MYIKKYFTKYFYWTHFSKCHASGNPNSFCANQYLIQEINLFEPELILVLGSKPINFLLGKAKLSERVNKIIYYKGIPVIVSLHPSRNWNFNRRPEFFFNETWKLIRKNLKFDIIDRSVLKKLI